MSIGSIWPEIDLAACATQIPSYIERAFDQAAYLAAHSDVASEVREGRFESALQHFAQYGRFEKRSVTLRSVPEWPEHDYLALYPDVRQSVMDGTFASGLEPTTCRSVSAGTYWLVEHGGDGTRWVGFCCTSS